MMSVCHFSFFSKGAVTERSDMLHLHMGCLISFVSSAASCAYYRPNISTCTWFSGSNVVMYAGLLHQ